MHSRHNLKEDHVARTRQQMIDEETKECTFQPNVHKYESKRIKVFDPTKED